MRIGICEDIIPHAQALTEQIAAYFKKRGYLCEISVFPDGASLRGVAEVFDLLFIDWKLPDGDGLTLAKELQKRDPAPTVVFVSAYKEYVFDSFEAAPFRYLVKPVSDELMTKTLDSFLDYFDRDCTVEIPTFEKQEFLRLRDIIYIESNRKRSIVRFNAPESAECRYYESTRSLAEFSKTIRSPRFFRTHKSYFVNMDYIKEISVGAITLTVGEHVALSRRNKAAFERAYNEYLKKTF